MVKDDMGQKVDHFKIIIIIILGEDKEGKKLAFAPLKKIIQHFAPLPKLIREMLIF